MVLREASVLFFRMFMGNVLCCTLTVLRRPTEVKMFAEKMLGHHLITKQTGATGRPCNKVSRRL